MTDTISPAAYRAMTTEASLQATVIEAVERLGYLWFHDRDARGNQSGHPDLHIVGHGLDLHLELKTATGRIRPTQRVWLRELQRATVHETRLVRPVDLDGILALLYRMAEEGRNR